MLPKALRRKKVNMTTATRSILRTVYKERALLRRIKNRLERASLRRQNQQVRAEVKVLKAAKRVPRQRIRSRDELGYVPFPPVAILSKNSSGIVTSTAYVNTGLKVQRGSRKWISDFHPIARTDPPRNLTTIRSFRRNALTATIEARHPKEKYYFQDAVFTGPIALIAMGAAFNTASMADISSGVGFDTAQAQKALIKAIAKVNEADIQLNEYLVEWKQVLNLLKDPMRTMIKFHSTLERWTRRSAWIWSPRGENYPGAVLINMRTRKELSLKSASTGLIAEASQRWLQYRYGIVPLAMDITTVMSLWERRFSLLTTPVKEKKARETLSKLRTEYQITTAHAPFSLVWKVVDTSGEFYSAIQPYSIVGEVPNSYRVGLHPSQWLNVIWNAIPYSFVGDWFINVDQYLTYCRSPSWIKLYGNQVTHKVYRKVTLRLVSAVMTSYGTQCTISGDTVGTLVSESMRREIDLEWPKTALSSYAWKSLKNALTGLALVIQPIVNKRR